MDPASFKVPQPSFPTHYIPQLDGNFDDSSSEEEEQRQSKRVARKEQKTAKRLSETIEECSAKQSRLDERIFEKGFASQINDKAPMTFMSDVIIESESDGEDKAESEETESTDNNEKVDRL